MTAIVSSGALMCGQCPVAFISRKVFSGISRARNSPAEIGAIVSSLHCMIRDGRCSFVKSFRLSERKVISAKRRAIFGSVAQKALLQLRAQLAPLSRPHHHRREETRPPQIILVHHLEQTLDIPPLETPDVIRRIINVRSRRAHEEEPFKSLL